MDISYSDSDHWPTEKLIRHAQDADQIANRARSDNPHYRVEFRKRAFEARKVAREKDIHEDTGV